MGGSVKQKTISVGDLAIGMYVASLDRPWLDTSFAFQGFPVRNEEDIAELRRQCESVVIDVEQSLPAVRKVLLSLPAVRIKPKPSPTRRDGNADAQTEPEDDAGAVEVLSAEVKTAAGVYSQAKSYIDTVFHDVRMGHSIDTTPARQLVSHVVDSVVRNANALLLLNNLKLKDEYTSQHCVNVCILAVAFGRFLGMANQELNELGLGALLHDIGKMRVPLEILNKPGRLTAAEFEVIKQHPVHGRSILNPVAGLPERALDVVISHHERIDGSGYPHGVRGKAISEFAMIVAIVDVYDAITSDRVYHAGMSPHDALTLMFEQGSQSFDMERLEAFIRCLGIYPVGSLVELNTGEVALVIGVNRKRQLRPMVMLLLDRDKNPYRIRRLLNLNQPGHTLEIKHILESAAYGLDVRRILIEEFTPAA